MGSEIPHHRERRRSERLLLRVPVKVFGKSKDGRQAHEDAEVVIVSRHGCLLRSDSALPNGEVIELFNKFTDKQATFKVVWCSDSPISDRWDVGLETETSAEEFWGVQFPAERGTSARG